MHDQIGPVLGRIPSGVFILTIRNAQGQETGMLASWVQQASFDPPHVTVAVNNKRYLNSWFEPGAYAVLNIVGESQKKLLGHFGKGFEPDEDAFQGLQIDRSPQNNPLLRESLGWLEGAVVSNLEAGDHTLYLLKLDAAGQGQHPGGENPFVHIRKNGMNY